MNPVLRKAIKAARLLREPRWRAGLRHGVAASIEHDRLPLDRAFQTVIDVGANRGQFALYARARFPGARVYSVEPLSGPRRRLQALFDGDPAVTVIPVAAGAAASTARINVSRHDDSSSLLAAAPLQTLRHPGTVMVGSEEVEVSTLDEIFHGVDLAPPILIKLDVQGFELEALKGAAGLLQRVDAVLAECSFVPFYEGQALFLDIATHLSAAGFDVAAGALSSAPANRWEQGDFLFERRRST